MTALVSNVVVGHVLALRGGLVIREFIAYNESIYEYALQKKSRCGFQRSGLMVAYNQSLRLGYGVLVPQIADTVVIFDYALVLTLDDSAHVRR
ncbi:hypothetical protein SAMN05414139_01372 [Burkholderia sp. D7]|nr:hypothetical protein SAMN05414139_01372 [Burkholderia sp. D7]